MVKITQTRPPRRVFSLTHTHASYIWPIDHKTIIIFTQTSHKPQKKGDPNPQKYRTKSIQITQLSDKTSTHIRLNTRQKRWRQKYSTTMIKITQLRPPRRVFGLTPIQGWWFFWFFWKKPKTNGFFKKTQKNRVFLGFFWFLWVFIGFCWFLLFFGGLTFNTGFWLLIQAFQRKNLLSV